MSSIAWRTHADFETKFYGFLQLLNGKHKLQKDYEALEMGYREDFSSPIYLLKGKGGNWEFWLVDPVSHSAKVRDLQTTDKATAQRVTAAMCQMEGV